MSTYRHIYVHVPFCSRRCSYCNFSIAVRREVPSARFVEALRAELLVRTHHFDRGPIKTLYLGGGTPSHLGVAGIVELLDHVRSFVALEPDVEVTLEANPEDVSDDAVRTWRAAGINRVSLGVQSFDDRVLEWMHRVHDGNAARRALDIVVSEFERVSADLIFSVPAALKRDVRSDLAEIIAAGPGHVSLYGLTVESGTPLHKWIGRGEAVEGSEEQYEAEYLAVSEMLRNAGFEHYEVSSFARPQQRSQHNSSYWTGAAYLGVGPAAHGFDGHVRRWNIPDYEAWLTSVNSGHDPLLDSESLTSDNRIAEQVYLGLRTDSGLQLLEGEASTVESWISAGWGLIRRDRLVLTPLGWLRIDALSATLTALRSH